MGIRSMTYALLMIVPLLVPQPLLAHPLDVTFMSITGGRAGLVTETRVTARQIALDFLGRENDFSATDIQRVESQILESYNSEVEWRTEEGTCTRTTQNILYNKESVTELLLGGITIQTAYVCSQAGALFLSHALFTDTFDQQRNIMIFSGTADGQQYVFTKDQTNAEVDVSSHAITFVGQEKEEHSFLASAGRFIVLGMEHVAIGYDHILFMLGIYLVVRKPKELLTVVTSFTVAHSITLILATLGVIQLSSTIIEAGIALTIVYIGIENIVKKTFAHRAYITFGLGLVHGLGFSSVLREIGIPKQYLIVDLLSFNIGVELGQLAIVLVLLPILWWISRRPKLDQYVVYFASIGISAIGLVWFVQRIGF